MQYFRTTAALLFALHLAGCADAPLSSPGDTGRLAPRRVEVIDIDAGQRLTRINFEDGRADSAAWQWTWPGLHRNSYAAQGIAIDSALFEMGSAYYHFARSGYNWIRPRENAAAYPVGFSPILISFNERVGGSVRGVRIHVARLYPGFNFSQPYAPYTLTCYEGQTPIGTASATPPTLYDGPLTYVPLEVRGSNISRCVVQPHAYFMMDDVEVTVARDDFQLECMGDVGENRVTRGEEIACTPRSGSNDAGIEIVSWSFSGVDSRGQPYRFPDEMDGPVTDSVWRGRMAISGTVTVRARVNGGEAQEGSAVITVESRDWSAMDVEHSVRIADFAEFSGNPDLPPAFPRSAHDLGRTFYGGEYLSPQDPGVVEFIDDYGPNHYLAFLARVPIKLVVAIIVHPAMVRGSDFYRRQRASSSDVAQGAPCVQGGFGRYTELILAHEGYPPTSQSHAGVFVREYQARAGAEIEELTIPDNELGALMEIYQARLDGVARLADEVSDREVDGRFPVRFGCEFNFSTR